ncbi:MAG: toxin-antitoxin system, antitoxin component [Spirochaetia bacterium]|jgi:hypothetical protein|nr:toxin-antitoxin system, antitoxin component [Spirochaetia bacterium]
MPQLSLYIDEITLRKIELAARIEKTSISRLVVKKLNESFQDKWPENFDKLFGSVNDKNFDIPDELAYDSDLKREEL